MGQRGADDARRAVLQRRHGVVQVGEAARAIGQRLDRLVVIGGAVADLNGDAARRQVLDQRVTGIAFGREGDQPHRRAITQTADKRQIGRLRERRLRA